MGAGLRDPDQRRAKVTLVVRDHGPADPAAVNQQIHTDAAPRLHRIADVWHQAS